jgi:regulatory subunit for Cdc7p protein kinase
MAEVSIPPSPHTLGNMSGRRAPLSNIPNAANSPFRALAAAASKRSRAQSGFDEDGYHRDSPPAKKQIVETGAENVRTPSKRRQAFAAEDRVFNRKPDAQPTAFERRLLAVKDKGTAGRPVGREKNQDEFLEKWQNYYRRVWPTFVFFFDSVPEESRKAVSRQIVAFGAVRHCLPKVMQAHFADHLIA